MIKAVLFDMDGVLFDSERMGRDIFVRECEARGYRDSDWLYPTLLGATYEMDVYLTQKAYGPDFPVDEIIRIFRRDLNAAARSGQLPMKPGAGECLAELGRMGLPTAIATGSGSEHAAIYLENCPELNGRFGAVIGGEMVENSKPAPDLYLKAAAALGVDPAECIGVEDSLNGVRALRAAGVTSVMVPDLLPFGPDFAPYTDHVLKDLNQLPDLIRRINRGGKLRA